VTARLFQHRPEFGYGFLVQSNTSEIRSVVSLVQGGI
jgi:hypothetical protein